MCKNATIIWLLCKQSENLLIRINNMELSLILGYIKVHKVC